MARLLVQAGVDVNAPFSADCDSAPLSYNFARLHKDTAQQQHAAAKITQILIGKECNIQSSTFSRHDASLSAWFSFSCTSVYHTTALLYCKLATHPQALQRRTTADLVRNALDSCSSTVSAPLAILLMIMNGGLMKLTVFVLLQTLVLTSGTPSNSIAPSITLFK